MGSSRFRFLILHCILPLIAGILIYLIGDSGPFLLSFKNYLPDGLWAFAFGSALLLIWDNRPPLIWLMAGWLMLVLTEWMQKTGLMPGTADWLDILVYSAGYGIAIGYNLLLAKLRNFKTPI
jgi:hypothetical protein